MQEVSENYLSVLRGETIKKPVYVVELYDKAATPPFDPADSNFVVGFSTVSGVNFRGRDYKQLLVGNSDPVRHIGKELAKFSMTLSNATREIIDYEYNLDGGFENLVCVLRLLDRSSVELADSAVQFTGRCEQPDEFERNSETAKIGVKQILNGTEIVVPRRTFSTDDSEGRLPSDPLFEGFRYVARTGAGVQKVKKKILFGLIKKTVTRSYQYSSHSDFDASRPVPLALGRVQMQGYTFASIDYGTEVQFISFFCEGKIKAISNVRSITEGFTLTNFTDNSIVDNTPRFSPKLGEAGGTGNQINDDPNFIGAGIYSKTAYIRAKATGTVIEIDDDAPDVAAVILGLAEIPILNADGSIARLDFSDNGILQTRWMFGDKNFFNLDSAWFDDRENFIEAEYCDHLLVDNANTDTVLHSESQTNFAGSAYNTLKSTGYVSPLYWKQLQLGAGSVDDVYRQETDYLFYENVPTLIDDLTGTGVAVLPPTTLRRRYTSNILLSEQVKAAEYVWDYLLPACGGYVVQKANGQYVTKIAKPADFAFFYAESTIGANEIHVKNINPFAAKFGRVLVGAYLRTSEVRTVNGYRYDSSVSIPVSASGGVSVSNSAISGGSNTVAPSVTVTVTNASGAKTLNIDGFPLTYNPSATDDTVTSAGFITGLINSHNELNKYVKAVWNKNSTVTVSSRIGYLSLDNPLNYAHKAAISDPTTAPTLTASTGVLAAGAYQICYSFETIEGETLTGGVAAITVGDKSSISVAGVSMPDRVVKVNWYASAEANGERRRLARTNAGQAWSLRKLPSLDDRLEPVTNSTGEEMLRIAMSFADKRSAQANLAQSNLIKGTFAFPLGSKKSSVNRVVVKYRSAADDFALTELTVNDPSIKKKGVKIKSETINGGAIDNYHQARRIANQYFRQHKDADLFCRGESDGEAMLLEEGDIFTVTDESGRYVNRPYRVEELQPKLSGYPSIQFVGKKYHRSFYDDQVTERIVPLPLVTNTPVNTEQAAPTIFQTDNALNAAVTISVTNYSTNARFRKIEVADDRYFVVNPVEPIVHSAQNEVGLILTGEVTIPRATNLNVSETKFIRVSHSSNGVTFGAASNVLEVSYPSNTGAGGSPPSEFPPSGGGTGTTGYDPTTRTGGGFIGGGHKIDPIDLFDTGGSV